MTTQYLHGIEVVEIDSGARPIRIADTSTIGLVGTAPDAEDAVAATLVTGTEAADNGITWTAATAGEAGNDILINLTAPASTGSALAVSVSGTTITVSLETDAVAGVSVSTGTEVVAAIGASTAASALVGVAALGTSDGSGVVAAAVKYQSLTGGSDAALPLNTPVLVTRRVEAARFGTTGTIPAALDGIWDQAGSRVVVVRVAEGVDDAATLSNLIGDGTLKTGVHALSGAESVVHLVPRILIVPEFSDEQSLVAELLGIADALRAVIVADGPNTTDAAAISYRENFGSDRLYIIDPQVTYWDRSANAEASQVASPRVAGVIARVDHEIGFWRSPSNNEIYGITGTARPVDFGISDPNSRANYLNENEVSTIVRQSGYRLWGDRSTSADPQWAFLCVRRTADVIHQSLIENHLWAVDRGITRTYFEDVSDGVNAFMANMVRRGAIIGGRCWVDAELNTPDQISQGIVYFDLEFTPVYPAEHIVFRSHLTTDYLRDIFASAAA